jgi:anti-anti-sigma regulatory factor
MSTAFELPEELTIYNAVETRDALLAWVTEHSAKSSQLEVSAREVKQVDGSGLQLLAALSNMDLHWRLVDASTALTQACRIMGLSNWLDSHHFKTHAGGRST